MADADETGTEGTEPSLADTLRAHRAQASGPETTPPPETPTGETPPSTDGETPPSTPPWNGDFNAERAWNTIQAQRETEKQLRAQLTRAEREKMNELDRTKAELTEARTELETFRIESLRSQVAMAKGLPATALPFLTGKDKKELETNADELLKLVGGREETPPPPDFGNGARPSGQDGESFTSVLRRAAGRS